MSFPSEIVAFIKTQVCNPDLSIEACGNILKECTRAIRNLNKSLKRAKSVSEKAHISACLGKLKGFQRILKNKKVGGGSGIRRGETATNRVKWDDVNSAFETRIRTGVITNLRHTDVLPFLKDCAVLFKRRILNVLRKDNSLKINAVLCGEFKISKPDELLVENKYLNTSNAPLYHDQDIEAWFKKNIQEPILLELDTFADRNSNWALSRVINLMFNINKYNPLRAGSYIDLPNVIAKKHACINVQNSDDMCFAWSVVSALYPVSHNTNKVSSYPNPQSVLNLDGIQFPINPRQIPRFESQNNLSINVYRLQKKDYDSFQVLPIYLTSNKQSKHVNLLVIQDNYMIIDKLNDNLLPVKYHYVWIKCLSRLLSTQLNKYRGKKHICDRCLHFFHSANKLTQHDVECSKYSDYIIPKVPTENHATVKFKNFQFKEKVPFVIYADTECLLIPFQDASKTNTQRYQNHVPFSIGFYVKCDYDETLSFYKSYTGSDCMMWFMRELQQFAEDVETVFQCPMPMTHLTPKQWKEYHMATHCHICEQPFTKDDKKVRDHNHIGVEGMFRGPAHESCNLNYQDGRTIPVIFHNLSSYDGHMLIKALTEIPGEIDLLPINKEKYISFTKKIENNTVQFRFLDSFRFLASGLDKLASYLDNYPILKNVNSELSEEQFSLLKRKGVFPYEYMNDWTKLHESQLPAKQDFYSSLEDKHISEVDYEHAQRVWTVFQCKNMTDYSNLYLKTDVLLLADVFEEFRNISIKTYGLDSAHAYSLPGYAWQCMLYITGQTFQLLTELDMILFVEKGIRGGLSQCSKRYAEANNKYMPNYKHNQDDSYLMYFDINNQYGWAMSQHLPHSGFKWLSDDEIQNLEITNISDTADEGYILEVDLKIPENLHEKFSDLPLCPEHKTPKGSKHPKLMATLYDKVEYVIHYRNLKQVIQLGVKITKIHKVLAFKQSAWLKQYIDLNTRLRQEAKNVFEKNLYKLFNNAVFGKTMENLRKHCNVKIITKWDGRYGAEALIARPEFRSGVIINENLLIIELAKTNVYFNRPIYVGLCILDIAKTSIYDFHYNYMKSRFSNCNLLYTDTDSLVYEIKHPDVYDIIKKDCNQYFDTSDYPENNIYGIPLVNKKVLGLMKDENNGRIMTHFVGLRSKMYATKILYTPEEMNEEQIKMENLNKEHAEILNELSNFGVTKKIKGIKKSVIKNTIVFDDYVECLETFTEKPISQNLIRSNKHELYTIKQIKIGLSPHDDKRIISRTSHNTMPWGHYVNMDVD